MLFKSSHMQRLVAGHTALISLQMNTERLIIRVGVAAMLSVLVVVAVVFTMHDDVSESVSALLQPTFSDLRIKLPPLPPLTEDQFKSLPPVSTMEYVPPTKAELKNTLARHGVQMHVFKNVCQIHRFMVLMSQQHRDVVYQSVLEIMLNIQRS